MTSAVLTPEEFVRRIHRYTPRLWVTATLVVINGAVYAAMVLSGASPLDPTVPQLFHWGGNAGIVTLGDGQYWRLFTCIFVHAGALHIGMNMFILWSIGRFIERLIGNSGALVVYLLSGLAGSLASAIVHPRVVSVGASGAIFGLYGVLLGFLLRHREALPPSMLRGLRNSGLAFVGYNLIFSAAVPGIDLSAHLGGLFGGFLLGLAVASPLTDEAARCRPWRIARVAVLGSAVLAAGAFLLRGSSL